MAKTANINIRIEPAVKAKADVLFRRLGTSTSEAVNMFLHKAIVYGGIPFEVALNVPNAETLEALREAEAMRGDPERSGFSSAKALFEDIERETEN